jgi:ubiquinone/menaquinone biosynthesis C-methylase UbiE
VRRGCAKKRKVFTFFNNWFSLITDHSPAYRQAGYSPAFFLILSFKQVSMDSSPIRQAYNQWSAQYDTNENKTRDLEGKALRQVLAPLTFHDCLEVGCGTGKNTEWLTQKAGSVTAVDLSEEMLQKAKQKINSGHVRFLLADIKKPWHFGNQKFDLVTFSLVLEHIEDLHFVFHEAAQCLKPDGYLYLGELHPYKQYTGSKARFDTENGVQVVEYYNHHISQFTKAAKENGMKLVELGEYFDEDNKDVPRILVLLFRSQITQM